MTRADRITQLREQITILTARRKIKRAGKLMIRLHDLVMLELKAEIRKEKRMASC